MSKINQEEYEVLKGLDDKWKWIARDEDGKLDIHGVGTSKRLYRGLTGNISHLFQFIQWEDSEPHNIAELIKEYEFGKILLAMAGEETVLEFKLESEETEVKSKQELIEKWESAIEATEFYGKGIEEKLVSYMKDFVSDLNQLDEAEALSQEWVDENKKPWTNLQGTKDYIAVDKLQNILVPKQEEITEDQAWELLKEKYEWPWADLRYTVMQQLEEGTAEAKMANLGYFEVEVDGVKYHVHEDAHTRIYDEAYEQGRSDSEREHEGDLPVIPQHVADWITAMHNGGLGLYPALKRLESNALIWEDVYEWYRKNTRKFVNAYLTGRYEVEEQKYRVLDGNTTLLGRINGLMLTTVEILEYYPEYAPTFDLTEQEIKDYDERYIPFMVPVNEVNND